MLRQAHHDVALNIVVCHAEPVEAYYLLLCEF